MKISGVVFDMDGTVLDSMYIWRNIGGEYLSSKGLYPDNEANKLLLSLPLSQSVVVLREKYQLSESPEQIRDEIDRILVQYYTKRAGVKVGIEDFLKLLREHKVKMCIATATGETLAKIALKASGLYSYFDEVLSCHSIKRGKEFPDIYELALQKLGTVKQETPIFEDALYAVKTAKEAGFTVMGIYDQSELRKEELKALADDYFVSYVDVIKSCQKGELKF